MFKHIHFLTILSNNTKFLCKKFTTMYLNSPEDYKMDPEELKFTDARNEYKTKSNPSASRNSLYRPLYF